MATLTISHNIFLTDDQINSLVKKEQVECFGVNFPVWFHEGTTSEPAQEIFCKYILTNLPEDYPTIILTKGYKINIPQIPNGYKLPVRPNKDEMSEMTKAEIEEWYIKNPMPATALDLIETGSLHFNKYSKNVEGDQQTKIVHIVDIKPMKFLENSI